MGIADPRDRLQPALLDRITDDARETDAVDDQRVMTKAQLRQAVLRDLNWLFNAVQPLGAAATPYPGVADSVLNFGLPPLSGQLASKIDVSVLERAIRQAILRFEPRILRETLEVRAVRHGKRARHAQHHRVPDSGASVVAAGAAGDPAAHAA